MRSRSPDAGTCCLFQACSMAAASTTGWYAAASAGVARPRTTAWPSAANAATTSGSRGNAIVERGEVAA